MALIDPSLLKNLGFLFNKRVTIQQATEVKNGFGEPEPTWADLAGHVAIPCVVTPGQTRQAGIRPDMEPVIDTSKILLQGHYPAITNEMRAVVGTQAFKILSVLHDSQDLTTKLVCELPA